MFAAVIMTPTRELALQITKECKKLSRSSKLHVVCVYGGTGISEQVCFRKFCQHQGSLKKRRLCALNPGFRSRKESEVFG